MKYIIPGLGEHCGMKHYLPLIKAGYNPINPDWSLPLSKQLRPISENDTIVGYSLGSILAYLIAKKYHCKLIMASPTPIRKYSLKYMTSVVGRDVAKDLKKIKVNLTKLNVITLAGDKEKLKTDLIVPKTGHKLNQQYIKAIIALK